MPIEQGADGERIYFSSTGRTLADEDQICVLSVGVDIGSSTSHLVFSRIVLERLDSRYVVTERETFYQSDILLTPYASADEIDADALGEFIRKQYESAMVDPEEIDAGALILTGVAVRRSNARRIGELFAAQAGKLVAVSAGDSLETVMAAYGSGAVARSIRDEATVMNVDVGGGTAKIAVCRNGEVVAITAADVGARLVCIDADRKVVRLEEAGRRFAADLGLRLKLGDTLSETHARALAGAMADRLFEAMRRETAKLSDTSLLRLDPLPWRGKIDEVTFSGGVAEYIFGWEQGSFGDLGALLGEEIRKRVDAWGVRLEKPTEGIRATVIGASQYTTQVSGSTIFVSPLGTLPLRNIPVIAPQLALDHEAIAGGLASRVAKHLPIVLAGDGDVGGLIGIHFREEMKLANPIVSIDGLELKEFDYIDIGEMLESSGAVPVVIKSLIFPTSTALGQEWKKEAVAAAT
jgi:ethanolamine utilization protein EutA